ncbi:MAG: pullulanase-associated domain-containing protein [Rhodospirillaceae bacterium]
MATVRIHYSRADSNQSDYDLWYWLNDPQQIDHTNFQEYLHEYPRYKLSFGENNYVDIDSGNNNKIQFYIKRKDGTFDHNSELCNFGEFTHSNLCIFCFLYGYRWEIDLNILPKSEFYINNTSPYLYKTSNYSSIYPVGISTTGAESLEGDGDNDVPVEDDKLRLFYDIANYIDIDIPENEVWYTKWEPWSQYYKSTINRSQLLYLRNKSYTVGENDMDLIIDADALATEKADAKQVLEKAIANCLYKLGEVPADFDEAAFLADVDAYKATKSSALEATIDYLKDSLDAHALLA